MLSKNDVNQLLTMAKKYNCVEALFVTGENPGSKYQKAVDAFYRTQNLLLEKAGVQKIW